MATRGSNFKRKLLKEVLYKQYQLRHPQPGIAGGDVFFVDGTTGANKDGVVASNTNDGFDPRSPWLTLTYALSQCTADNNDTIFVLDYWRPTGETWPISITKNRVHIIGLAQPNLPYPAIHPATDVAAFQLNSSGQYGSIQNLTIGGGNSHGGIDWQNSGQVDGYLIKNCTFGHQWFGTPLSGIYQISTASRGGYGNIIDSCRFLSDQSNCSGAITGNGIDMAGAVTSYDLEVTNCWFMGCAVGINLADGDNCRFLNNKFICPDAADGEAITLASPCRGNMVDGNVAMNGGDAAMTKQPYVDIAATNKNHWGVNWTSNAVDLPKQTA